MAASTITPPMGCTTTATPSTKLGFVATPDLAPHLRTYRPLRQVSVADVLAPLVHHPSPVGPAHAEARLPHLRKQGIAIAALDEGAQGRVGGAHLLPPGRGRGD